MNLPLIDQTRDRAVGEIPATGFASSFERRRLRAYLGLIVVDVAALLVGYFLAHLIYLGGFRMGLARGTLPAQLMLPVYLTLALYNGTYSLPSLSNWKSASSRAITALLIAATLFNFIVFFVRIETDFSRTTFVIC